MFKKTLVNTVVVGIDTHCPFHRQSSLEDISIKKQEVAMKFFQSLNPLSNRRDGLFVSTQEERGTQNASGGGHEYDFIRLSPRVELDSTALSRHNQIIGCFHTPKQPCLSLDVPAKRVKYEVFAFNAPESQIVTPQATLDMIHAADLNSLVVVRLTVYVNGTTVRLFTTR